MSAPIRRLTGGPITPELLRLAWPVFVSHLLHTLYGLADMLWVGRVSAEAIGAVSACFFASWSLMAIGDLFTAGVGALVAQAVGADRDADASLVARTGLLASALTGAVISAIGWFASPTLFRILFEDPRIAEMSANYFRIYSLIAPGFYAAFVIEAIFRSCGDSRTPMLFTLVGVLLNLVLDPLLILGAGPFPRLEVQGAALATVASHAVVVALVAVLAWRRRIPLLGAIPATAAPTHPSSVSAHPSSDPIHPSSASAHPSSDPIRPSADPLPRFSRADAWSIVRIGTPTAAVGILFSVVYLLISKLTESFGAPALAALGIVNRLESVNYLTSAAMGMGVAAMVGQNLGARQPDRAERVADRGAALITLTTGIVGGLYLLVPEFFVRLFTEDPAAVAESVNFLRIVAISQVFMGWEMVYGQAFTGAGDTLPPMHISVWMSVLRVPLAWWFADHTSGGLDGVWWVISLTCILRGILVAGWFRVGRWKTRDARFVPLPPAALVPSHGPDGPEG